MAKKQSKISEQEQIDQASKKDDELFNQLSEEQKEQLLDYVKLVDNSKKPLRFCKSPEGGIMVDPDFPGGKLAWVSALKDATGTFDIEAGVALINQAASINGKFDVQQVNTICALLQGIRPQNEIEGMLAAQMVATHNTAMMMLRDAGNGKWVDNVDKFTSMATKLLRTFTAQVEALKKYRSKGEQKVIVEHVHVHQGGQAIVGAITQTRGEGVADEKQGTTPRKGLLEQETGTVLELQKRETLRCENEAGDTLSHALHAERKM